LATSQTIHSFDLKEKKLCAEFQASIDSKIDSLLFDKESLVCKQFFIEKYQNNRKIFFKVLVLKFLFYFFSAKKDSYSRKKSGCHISFKRY
jgi:hypothetical protein